MRNGRNVWYVRNDGTTPTSRSSRSATFPTFLTFPTFPTFPTFLTFLTFLTACHSSPEQEQEKIRQELASWDATARLTRELAERGVLPRVYIRQVNEAVEQGRKQAQQRQAKLSE